MLIFVSNDDTSTFICTFPSDTSLEANRDQDFHQIFSHRHFYWTKWDALFIKNRFFVFFERPNDDSLNFLCAFPIPPTELLKNAKNRFKIGLVFLGKWHKYQNLVCIAKTSCLFETHCNQIGETYVNSASNFKRSCHIGHRSQCFLKNDPHSTIITSTTYIIILRCDAFGFIHDKNDVNRSDGTIGIRV